MEPRSPEWFAQVAEDVVDPEQRIVDPHHHLWPRGHPLDYGLDDLHADTGDGHRVVATVFVECRSAYRREGPEHLRPVGETEFVVGNATEAARRTGQARIRGIVGHADLSIGERLDEVLDAHEKAGGGLFRGIRHHAAFDPDPVALSIRGTASSDLYEQPAFRAGVARLGERGLTYDAWHYHHQNADFAAMAAAVPETTMVLDHFGTPLGVGRFAGRLDDVFEEWKLDIAALAALPNVVAKLGGLAMPDNGYGWHERARPADSDEIVAAHERWYLHTIDCFGPDRTMFESNFPVDRLSVSYRVLWNAFEKMASRFDRDEREQLFAGTAERVYRLERSDERG